MSLVHAYAEAATRTPITAIANNDLRIHIVFSPLSCINVGTRLVKHHSRVIRITRRERSTSNGQPGDDLPRLRIGKGLERARVHVHTRTHDSSSGMPERRQHQVAEFVGD